MGQLEITVNSKMLERTIFVIIIIGLIGLNIYQWTGKDNAPLTAQVTKETSATKAASAIAPIATCDDNIINQGEIGVDCGGPCKGYFYDGVCNDAPKPECTKDTDCKTGFSCTANKCLEKTAEQTAECRLNSDCKEGFKCDVNKCVVIPPECVKDADCKTGYQCAKSKCEEIPLSGNLDVMLLNAEITKGTGTNTKKVTSVKIRLTNGKTKSILLYGKLFVYIDKTDPFYNIGKQFDIGSIKSGETIEKIYTITSMPSFTDDGEDRKATVKFYTDDDEEFTDVDGTVTKVVYP